MIQPTVIDLFCGCGGMSWGLHKAGFKILAGVDHWRPALNTFRHNHPEALAIEADLTTYPPEKLAADLTLTPGELDCLIGGSPCQGFSKNIPAAYRFLEDPRNQLFRHYLDFVAYLRPRVVIMENVAEIYNAYRGSVREEITAILSDLGYQMAVKVMVASEYGVPQNRRRCFFIASRTGVNANFPPPMFASESSQTLFNRVEKFRSAWSAISDLPPLENGEGCEPMPYTLAPQNEYQATMRQNATALYDHITRKLNEKQYARVASLQPGQGFKELPDHLKPRSGYSGAYGRLDFENPAPTITRWVFHPGSGRYCHPQNARLITIREAARLQSFSDDFRFTGTYIEKAHQVGNAVPPMLMEVLAATIKACLTSPEAVQS